MKINRLVKAGIKFLKSPSYRFLVMAELGLFDNMPDEEYLAKRYKAKTGKEINLSNPASFNEKLQWLKLNDRKSVYTTMVDKYAVKEYVSKLLGEKYVIPLLGVWNSFDEIDFEKLPNQFVLKCTHGCGGMVICRDKTKLDVKKAKKIINRAMKQNYYLHVREWPYKDVVPRILAEEYIEDKQNKNLTVYKVFNFSGGPQIIQTIQNDKTPEETIDYFDEQWNRLDIRQNYPNSKFPLGKPVCLDEMLMLSRRCSEDFAFLRTDWYEVEGKVFFSEFTFYSDAGMEPFYPDKWDIELGNRIELPE